MGRNVVQKTKKLQLAAFTAIKHYYELFKAIPELR